MCEVLWFIHLRHNMEICPKHANSQGQSCPFHTCTAVYQDSIFHTNVSIFALNFNPTGSEASLVCEYSRNTSAAVLHASVHVRTCATSRGRKQTDVETLECMCESSFWKQKKSLVFIFYTQYFTKDVKSHFFPVDV